MKPQAAQMSPAATDLPQALALLRRHGQNPSAFLGLNDGNEYFTTGGISGVIAYRPYGRRYWIQFTGACAEPAERAELDRAFAAAAAAAGRRVIAVQLHRDDAERAIAAGFVVNQFGASYSIDLADFTLRGQKFVKTRNMIARSGREGVTVTEADADRQADPAFVARLAAIDAMWLRDKGRHVKQMRFMIGQRGGAVQHLRKLFVAEANGEVVAYVSYSPTYGDQAGWLYDLTRRMPDAPPGVIEHIFADAAQQLHAAGAGWLHLGLTPFVGLEPAYHLGSASPLLTRALPLIRTHGAALYPADRQLAFKLKWRPHLVVPEYIAFPGRLRARDIWCFARATNSL
jgi:lysylphosphatidylglycerol synthetase-like protein (DUF2156 family)